MFSLGTFNTFGSTYKSYNLWKQWYDKDSGGNINIMIAKDIDKIQLLYKLASLQEQQTDAPYFDYDRFSDLLDEEKRLDTPIGRRIFHRVIEDHPRYAKHLKSMDSVNGQDKIKLVLKAFTFNPKTAKFIGKGFGGDSADVDDSSYEMIRKNPRSMTKQSIDGREMILINLCSATTNRKDMKFVKNAAVLHLHIYSHYPILKFELEDAYSIKSSKDDCYELSGFDVSQDCNSCRELAHDFPIAYAYAVDSDAPSLNCERLMLLNKDVLCENRDVNILVEPNRANDVLSLSSTAYLYKVIVDIENRKEVFRRTLLLARDDKGQLIQEADYFSEGARFESLMEEQNRICGKPVSWKKQTAVAMHKDQL